MQVRRNFDPEVVEKLETIPIEQLEKFLGVQRRKGKQQKTKSAPAPSSLKAILDFKPIKVECNLTEVIREERDKPDSRNFKKH